MHLSRNSDKIPSRTAFKSGPVTLGASPVMAHTEEGVEEMAGIASALVINIGTRSPAWGTCANGMRGKDIRNVKHD